MSWQPASHAAVTDEFFKGEEVPVSNDICGVEGFVFMQKEEVDRLKAKLRQDNKEYIAKHPEIKRILLVFLLKVLDQKPLNIIAFAGNFLSK